MIGIVGVIALLVVLGLSLLITRIATIALALTGLSWEASRFQARSAFTGTGFTTREAERVVDHPVRRRIIMALMILRSAGFVTITISLILSFVGSSTDVERLIRLFYLVGGIIILLVISRTRIVDKTLGWVVSKALKRWTDLDVRDYASLLHLSGPYSVMEVNVRADEWLVGKRLKDCRLPEEGVKILGLYRDDGSYVGIPRGDTQIYEGDRLIMYGRSEALRELDRRRAGLQGDVAHEQAVGSQQREIAEEERREEEHQKKREQEEQKKEAAEGNE